MNEDKRPALPLAAASLRLRKKPGRPRKPRSDPTPPLPPLAAIPPTGRQNRLAGADSWAHGHS